MRNQSAKNPKKIQTDCANETGGKNTGCLVLMVGRRFDRGMTRLETTPPDPTDPPAASPYCYNS